MDFRARVTTGRCPVMVPSSSTMESRSFWFRPASPAPTFTVTLAMRGTWWGFAYPKRSVRRGRTCSR
jgi:hypothetical protein